MDNYKKMMNCVKIAYFIENDKMNLSRNPITCKIIRSPDELYRTIIVFDISYGIFTKISLDKVVVLPKFMAVDDSEFGPFEHLILHFISKYCTVYNLSYPKLEARDIIYYKEIKHPKIHEIIEIIRKAFA